jgi:ubiquinone/menaquinone biosynthesis C-methylase UbiE
MLPLLLLPLALAVPGAHDDAAAHSDGATVHHRFDDVDRWVKIFDDPERAAWQQPALLVGSLGISKGSTVADIGAGTGYFLPHLADAVGADGKVLAVDIERSLVAHMRERVRDAGLKQVEVRLGATDDPALVAAEVDLVLLVDTYHHIDDRVAWFTRLRGTVRPGGRLAVVDFKPGDLPVGPPPEHRVAAEQVDAELGEAGWRKLAAPDVLPYQFVRVYELAP